MALPGLGINTWQFHRRHPDHDLAAALSAAAGCGFQAVEIVGQILDPPAIRAHLDALGLSCIARHLVLPDLDDLAGVLHAGQVLGFRHVCSSGLRIWDRREAADYRDAAAALDRAGRALGEAGIRLHYHNHEFEFQAPAGQRPGIETLLSAGDPLLWDLCLDVGWVLRAGADPLAVLTRHQERISYVHLRDFSPAGASLPLGQGAIDLDGIVGHIAASTRIGWAMVEQEPRQDPAADARASREHLRSRYRW